MSSVLSLSVLPSAPALEPVQVRRKPWKEPGHVPEMTQIDLLKIGKRFVDAIPAGPAACAAVLREAMKGLKLGSGWFKRFRSLVRWFDRECNGPLPGSILVPSNDKVPFWQFSTLSIVTCPGAGPCAKYCYTRQGWRNVSPYLRQLMNTYIIRVMPWLIEDAFRAIPEDVFFRLYVDGDFSSLEEISLWMNLFKSRPDVKGFGYSKSWALLLEWAGGNTFPPNYLLNLSNGGRKQGVTLAQMEGLSVTRDQFVALNVGWRPKGRRGNIGSKEKYASKDYHKAVLEAAQKAYPGREVKSCPGDCGNCSDEGPICGLPQYKGVVVAISIH